MEETAKKALVLDDEEVILNTCREILEETGLEIITSTSPAECIDIASAGGIDLFITDIMMPELNGVEVVRRIQKNKSPINGYRNNGLSIYGHRKRIYETRRLRLYP